MITVDNELRQIYKNDSLPNVQELADKQLQLYFPDLDLIITNEGIVADSFSLTESLCSDTDLVFGSCESSQLSVTVADISQDLAGQIMVVTQIVNSTYTVNLGTYKIDSAKKQSDRRFKDVIAYDRIYDKLDVDVSSWYNNLFSGGTTSCTLAQFRASLFTYIGLTTVTQTLPNDNMTVTKTIEPTKLSGRDVAMAIGEINGMFGHMTRDNKFKYIGLGGLGLYPSETLYPAEDLFPSESGENLGTVGYKSCDYEEYYVHAIDKLQIRTDDEDIGSIVGDGTNAYIVEGNFLVYGKNATELATIANNMFLVIKNKYYRPHISVIPGLPYLEVGDSVNIITSNDVIESFVFSRTLTGIQILTDTISAAGNEYREENFSRNIEIEQLKAKTLKISKTVDGLTSTVSNLETNTQSAITQLENDIELKVDSSSVINAINVSTEGVKIKASKLTISGYVSFDDLSTSGATEINGSNITTGSLSCNRLSGGTISGQSISGGTISGTSITGGTITGTAITGATLSSVNTSGTSSVEISGGYFESTSNTMGTTEILGGSISCKSLTVNGRTPLTSIPTLYSDDIIGSSGSTSGQVSFSNVNVVGWDYAHRTFAQQSDLRLKFDVQDLENIDGFYMELRPKKFRFKDGFDNYVVNTGLIAQQVLNNAEENNIETGMVYKAPNVLEQGNYCSDGWHYNLRYDDLHAFHIKMIQKHENEIQALKEENQSIKNELSELKALLQERGVI